MSTSPTGHQDDNAGQGGAQRHPGEGSVVAQSSLALGNQVPPPSYFHHRRLILAATTLSVSPMRAQDLQVREQVARVDGSHGSGT